MKKTISRSQDSRIKTLTKRQEFKTTNFSTKLSVSLRNFYSRAIARSRGLIAGDPGGVSACKFVSSTLPVCMTVILCLKSNGKEIWPGAFFKSCRGRNHVINLLSQSSLLHLLTFNFEVPIFPRLFNGVGALFMMIFSSRPSRSSSRFFSSCASFIRFSCSRFCCCCIRPSSSSLLRNS